MPAEVGSEGLRGDSEPTRRTNLKIFFPFFMVLRGRVPACITPRRGENGLSVVAINTNHAQLPALRKVSCHRISSVFGFSGSQRTNHRWLSGQMIGYCKNDSPNNTIGYWWCLQPEVHFCFYDDDIGDKSTALVSKSCSRYWTVCRRLG